MNSTDTHVAVVSYEEKKTIILLITAATFSLCLTIIILYNYSRLVELKTDLGADSRPDAVHYLSLIHI